MAFSKDVDVGVPEGCPEPLFPVPVDTGACGGWPTCCSALLDGGGSRSVCPLPLSLPGQQQTQPCLPLLHSTPVLPAHCHAPPRRAPFATPRCPFLVTRQQSTNRW